MTRFNPGDLVFLKSGSPLMTVRTHTGRIVECDWFIDDEPVGKLFHAAQLAAFEEQAQPNCEPGQMVLVKGGL